MTIGDRSCSIDGYYSWEFLLFEIYLCRLGQLVLASAVLMTSVGRQLPCISKWGLRGSQFSWLLLWLQRWLVIQCLLRLMFRISISSWLRGFRFLLGGGGFGFLDDIPVAVFVPDHLVCSILCCVPIPFSECHISGAVMRPGQLIVYEVLLSRYAVPNKYAGSGSVIHLLAFLFRNMHESQASEHTEMHQE